MTRLMYQRALGGPAQWQWNTGGNADPINVFPHAGSTMNAFYQRSTKSLRFFFFDKPGVPAPPRSSSPAARSTSWRTKPATPSWTD